MPTYTFYDDYVDDDVDGNVGATQYSIYFIFEDEKTIIKASCKKIQRLKSLILETVCEEKVDEILKVFSGYVCNKTAIDIESQFST